MSHAQNIIVSTWIHKYNELIDYYTNNKNVNIIALRQLADRYLSNFQQDVGEFLTYLCCNIDNIKIKTEHCLNNVMFCLYLYYNGKYLKNI